MYNITFEYSVGVFSTPTKYDTKSCELRLTIIKNQLNAMSNGAIGYKSLTVHISSVCLSFAF